MSHGRWLVVLVMAFAALGCARVVVRKDPGPRDVGVRFYRPKPYLFIGPAMPDEPAPDGQGGAGKAVNDGAKPVVIQLKYLPDFSEEYSIRMTPGFNATTEFNPTFKDGWMLTGFSSKTDQNVDDLIKSVGDLLGGVAGLGKSAKSVQTTKADIDVPLGFYEAVILPDACGRKQLLGWRYIGFFPIATCPIAGCAGSQPAGCDPSSVWGLVIDDSGSLRFKRMDVVAGYAQVTVEEDTKALDHRMEMLRLPPTR